MNKRDKSGLTFLVLLSLMLLSQGAYAQTDPIVLRFDFPEPMTLLLVGFGGLALLRKRRRSQIYSK